MKISIIQRKPFTNFSYVQPTFLYILLVVGATMTTRYNGSVATMVVQSRNHDSPLDISVDNDYPFQIHGSLHDPEVIQTGTSTERPRRGAQSAQPQSSKTIDVFKMKTTFAKPPSFRSFRPTCIHTKFLNQIKCESGGSGLEADDIIQEPFAPRHAALQEGLFFPSPVSVVEEDVSSNDFFG